MGWPLAIAAGVGVLRAYGQYRANIDQAAAEDENAKFFREQERFAELSSEREEAIFSRQADQLFGNQASAIASSGFEFSGTNMQIMAETKQRVSEEKAAIRMEGNMRTRLARLRAESTQRGADALRDSQNNTMQAVGTILGSAGPYMGGK